jgi:putative ABC transport system permease protein
VAIDRAGEAATGSFQSSLKTLLGTTDLEIHANGGVDETVLARLSALPYNVQFAPVIETQVNAPGAGLVSLYGVDAVAAGQWADPSEGSPAAISSALARSLKVQKGSQLQLLLDGMPVVFKVALIIEPQNKNDSAEFVVIDIADAQRLLNVYGRVDRIDVLVSQRETFEVVEREIRAALPQSYAVERPGVRSEENQRMLRAFKWNLRVLSYISLVVGAFLIYNTVSISVVRRRAEIGILRAVGTDRTWILGLFLGEALLFGIAGSVIGVGFGRLMAEGAVGLIAQTVNALYTSSRPAPIELTPASIALGMFTGLAVSLLSALAPSIEAMKVTPVSAMSRGEHEQRGRLHWKRDLLFSFGLAIASIAAAQGKPLDGKPVWGYASAFLAIGSAALAAPAVVLAVARLTRGLSRRAFQAEGLLANRSLIASLPRTAVVVGALATAVGMMTSVGIMVGSFRETVLVWLDYQLRADLYIRASGRAVAGEYPAIDPAIPDLIQSVPGVAAVDVFSGLEYRFRGVRATVASGDMSVVRKYGRLRFLPGQDRDTILASLPDANRVIISEPFANKHDIHAGDTIELDLEEKHAVFTVAGVYYEYSSEFGYVLMDRTTWRKILPNRAPSNLAVYLAAGADKQAIRREIQKRTAGHRILIADNRTLREGAVVIFDRTFAITYALEAIAVFVAMLGAANSLLALVLDRRREIGMLRFLGASPEQVRRLILVEAGFIGFLANLLGLVLGAALSTLLIFVINKQSFGWTIQFQPPLALLGVALALIGVSTVVAAIYPARVASNLNPIDAVHTE